MFESLAAAYSVLSTYTKWRLKAHIRQNYLLVQGRLDGQVAATQPYKTAAQAKGADQPLMPQPRRVVPPLAIVLMCAGTRGDVQPFIALGLQLQVGCLCIMQLNACIMLVDDITLSHLKSLLHLHAGFCSHSCNFEVVAPCTQCVDRQSPSC